MDGVDALMNMAQIRNTEARQEFRAYLETDQGKKDVGERGLFRAACAWWYNNHLRFLAPEMVV